MKAVGRTWLAAVSALILCLSTPVMALANSFPEDCDDTGEQPENNARYRTEKQWPGVPYLYYDGGTSTLDYDAQPEPCLQFIGGGNNDGYAAIFPVNIDRHSTGNLGFVQLGIIRSDSNHPILGEPAYRTFFTMANDDDNPTQGLLSSATSWAGTPATGQDYRLRISAYFRDGGWKWIFHVTNLNNGVVKASPYYSATFHTGTRVWFLYETLNGNSQLGADDFDPQDIRIVDMKYRTTDGSWFQHSPAASTRFANDAVSNYRHSSSTAGTGSYWAWTIDN